MFRNKFVRTAVVVVALAITAVIVRQILRWQQHDAAVAATHDEIKQVLFIQDDPSLALKRIAEALAASPEDGWLYLYQGRAYARRGRYGDAIKSYTTAQAHLPDGDEEARLELTFLEASARAMRFCETRDPEERNLAEPALERLSEGGRFASAARVFLGLALAESQEGDARARARSLLESGLADLEIDPAVDVKRAQDVLSKLR